MSTAYKRNLFSDQVIKNLWSGWECTEWDCKRWSL